MAVSEERLAAHIIEWLEQDHWDVYQEVRIHYGDRKVQIHYGDRIADIVGVRANLCMVVETKTSFALKVVEQAYRWRGFAHFVAVAYPYNTNSYSKRDERWFRNKICHDYGIGVISVGFDGHSFKEPHIDIPPRLDRSAHKFRYCLSNFCRPEHKYFANAGNAANSRFSPYQSTITYVKNLLRTHGHLTIQEIVNLLDRHHYASDQTAKSCLLKGLREWESDWCACDNSVKPFRFYIKDDRNAISQY